MKEPDLIERLRQWPSLDPKLMHAAADEIDALRARLAEAERIIDMLVRRDVANDARVVRLTEALRDAGVALKDASESPAVECWSPVNYMSDLAGHVNETSCGHCEPCRVQELCENAAAAVLAEVEP